MNILVDTCIWSLALRRKPTASLSQEEQEALRTLTNAIQNGRAAIIGPIRQEILSGIKDPTAFQKIRNALAAFRDESLLSADFEEAALLDNQCRSLGITPGPIDILICATARRRGWEILSSDAGLRRCLDALN